MSQPEQLSLKSKISLAIVFIVFSSITTCGSEKVRVGEKAILNFEYPCASTEVTLQQSNRPPFYKSNNSSSVPFPPNYLLENQNDSARNECSLHLTINPVSRDDQGTYIPTAYKNGAMLPDYPRIYLGVDYPPGKASCELSNDYNDGEWVSLQCTAPVGTLPGQILCYQNDMRLPKGNELEESDRNLNQIILARLDHVVYCCSSILTKTKDKCNCTDWGWDLMSDSVSDIEDPCPQVMSTEDPTSTHSISTDSSSSNLATAPTKYPENHKTNSYWIVTWVLLVTCFVIIITLSIKYHRKVRELEHLISSIKPGSKDPCLSVNGEEVEEHNV